MDRDVLLGRFSLGGGLRFVPIDVLDRSEELVKVLEQIVAVAFVRH
jgi:hypothetical protein